MIRTLPIETFVDHVARSVSGIARRRPRRLVALTVEAPRNVPPANLIGPITERLTDLGLGEVQLRVVAGRGDGRVTSMEFER